MQVKKQQLEPDMEQRTGSKLGKEYINGHGFGWTPGVGDGQGGLVCCGSWGHKE